LGELNMSGEKTGKEVKEYPTIQESIFDYFRILYKPGEVLKRRGKKNSDLLTSFLVVLSSSVIFSMAVLISGGISYTTIHWMFTTYLIEFWTSVAPLGLYLPSGNILLTTISLIIFLLKLWLFGTTIYWILLKIFRQDVSFIEASDTIAWSTVPVCIISLILAIVSFGFKFVYPLLLYSHIIFLLPIPIIMIIIAPIYQAYFNMKRVHFGLFTSCN
jgi:hypothetical protein